MFVQANEIRLMNTQREMSAIRIQTVYRVHLAKKEVISVFGSKKMTSPSFIRESIDQRSKNETFSFQHLGEEGSTGRGVEGIAETFGQKQKGFKKSF
jgi:hypothetical protein